MDVFWTTHHDSSLNIYHFLQHDQQKTIKSDHWSKKGIPPSFKVNWLELSMLKPTLEPKNISSFWQGCFQLFIGDIFQLHLAIGPAMVQLVDETQTVGHVGCMEKNILQHLKASQCRHKENMLCLNQLWGNDGQCTKELNAWNKNAKTTWHSYNHGREFSSRIVGCSGIGQWLAAPSAMFCRWWGYDSGSGNKIGIVCVVGMFNMIHSAALHLSRFKSGFVWKTLEFNLNYFASRYPNWKKETKPHAQHYIAAGHFVVTWNLHTTCHLQKVLAVQKQRRSLLLTRSSNPTESRGEKQPFHIIRNVRSLFTLTCPAKFSKVGLKWCI